ncbi:hypothetical protein RDI58_027134 [Solanum bulbocastanum]|uniref:DUF4283 domain-containing protein n=1 Tax=Solanum bulbocastanum TaxID=147425 RepID=A0AAN8SUU2_SOLBU
MLCHLKCKEWDWKNKGKGFEFVNPFRLIGVGLTVWTFATAGCGLSINFWSITICRMMVGVGEASFISLAAPFIDDNAPVDQKTAWLGIFYMCIPTGIAVGYVYGGLVGSLLNWRWAFGIEALLMFPFAILGFVMKPLQLKGFSHTGSKRPSTSVQTSCTDAVASPCQDGSFQTRNDSMDDSKSAPGILNQFTRFWMDMKVLLLDKVYVVNILVGFKSFDITRSCGTTEIWYEWTERSRNFIRRTTFNKMTMEWISLSLREALKVVEGSKWQSSKYEAPTSKDKKTESEVIAKSREQVWKKAFGVNIYEMLGGHYLFEFPNRYMAEQILQGEWIWKRNKIKLDWWNPYVGCEPTTYKPKSTWIRVMGLPMHLWTDETFKEIGELCGGWVRTEEETELRNHLKWARIEIRGDGRSIRSEVSISRDGIKFIIPIWAERKTLFEFPPESNRTTTGEDQLKIQRIIDLQSSISEKAEVQVVNVDVTKGNHVEVAVQILKKSKVACARHVQIFKNKDWDSRSIGPDQATIIFNNFSPQPNSDLQEVVIDESLENYSSCDETGRKTPNLQNLEGTQAT